MDFTSEQKDQAERMLRQYLATRPDVSKSHREKIVSHYMFIFNPDYTDEAGQKHIEKQAKGDPHIKRVASEVLASFYQWLTGSNTQKTSKVNFFTNLFTSKN